LLGGLVRQTGAEVAFPKPFPKTSVRDGVQMLRKEKPAISGGFLGGRGWARTSDPQLVETWWAFTPVRARSLYAHGSWGCAVVYRTRPNPNERRVLPLFPLGATLIRISTRLTHACASACSCLADATVA